MVGVVLHLARILGSSPPSLLAPRFFALEGHVALLMPLRRRGLAVQPHLCCRFRLGRILDVSTAHQLFRSVYQGGDVSRNRIPIVLTLLVPPSWIFAAATSSSAD